MTLESPLSNAVDAVTVSGVMVGIGGFVTDVTPDALPGGCLKVTSEFEDILRKSHVTKLDDECRCQREQAKRQNVEATESAIDKLLLNISQNNNESIILPVDDGDVSGQIEAIDDRSPSLRTRRPHLRMRPRCGTYRGHEGQTTSAGLRDRDLDDTPFQWYFENEQVLQATSLPPPPMRRGPCLLCPDGVLIDSCRDGLARPNSHVMIRPEAQRKSCPPRSDVPTCHPTQLRSPGASDDSHQRTPAGPLFSRYDRSRRASCEEAFSTSAFHQICS